MEKLDNLQTDVVVKRNINAFAIVFTVIITTLLVGGGVYLQQNSLLKSTKSELESEINQLRDQVEVKTVCPSSSDDASTELYPTEETKSKSNWEKHSGKGFFKYSISTPKNSYVCIGETATGGNDFGCFPEGVYLENKSLFPYGISFEQTYLMNVDLEGLSRTFGYEGYKPSDIDFGADNQIMVSGVEKLEFIDQYNAPTPITKEVRYTKYLFTKIDDDRKDGKTGYEIYMPKIYTDLALSDYDLYKKILETWTFE